MGIAVELLGEELAESAADRRARHPRLRLPAAMVLACAHVMEADLLTYDERLAGLAG